MKTEKRVLEAMPARAITMFKLAARPGLGELSCNQIRANLMMLELRGKVRQLPALPKDKDLGSPLNSRWEKVAPKADTMSAKGEER